MCDKVYYDQKCLMCNVVVKISVQHIIVSYALKSDEPLSHSHSLSLSPHFNGHFPGGPGLAGTRMLPFWILLELRAKGDGGGEW